MADYHELEDMLAGDPELDELRARISDLEVSVEGLEQMLREQAAINAKVLALLQPKIEPKRSAIIMPTNVRELN